MTDNIDKIVQEAECVAAADEYFKARTWLMDTNDNRRIFEAGFDRAYALLSKLRAPVAPVADERDRKATISQIVGLCNRIPGATTWNAAQFMYDEMHRRAALASAPVAGDFQARVQPWMMACFGREISADRQERNHRFIEEALELIQACGASASEAHQLVDYVFSRPIGEPVQEVGGVMVTLAALCLANGLDMHEAGELELARISEPVIREKIRAKQAAKPKHSPLPEASSTPVAGEAQPVAWREVDRNGHAMTCWYDGNPGVNPVPSQASFSIQRAYAVPQASEAVRDVEDAERWRWATASDGNADKLCSIVLCHGGYQDKINERADFYRAALSAQPGAQRTGGGDGQD